MIDYDTVLQNIPALVALGVVLLTLMYFAMFRSSSADKPYSTREDRAELENEINDIFSDVPEKEEYKVSDAMEVAEKEKEIDVGDVLRGDDDDDDEDEEDDEEEIDVDEVLTQNLSTDRSTGTKDGINVDKFNVFTSGYDNYKKAEELFEQKKYVQALQFYWHALNGLTTDVGQSNQMNYEAIYKKFVHCFDNITKTPEEAHAQLHLFMAKCYLLEDMNEEALQSLKLSQEFDCNNMESMTLAAQTLGKLGINHGGGPLVRLVPPRTKEEQSSQ